MEIDEIMANRRTVKDDGHCFIDEEPIRRLKVKG
jgi:hypothetical protein